MLDGGKISATFNRNRLASIELQQLRYIVAAADHGSFRRAAEALLLRQSTLSRCISQFEQHIGSIVFERSNGGVLVTNAGHEVLQAARSILEQVETLVASAHANGRGEAGKLAVGFYTSLSAGNLRATLIDFSARFPQVGLSMIERSRAHLGVALCSGTVDIVIITGEAPLQRFKKLALWSERIMVAVPKGHSLAAQEVVYWTDLRDETVLLSEYDQGRELENLLMSKLVAPEERPRIVRHDVSRGIIKSLVSAGFGVSLVTESDVGASLSDLVYVELRDGAGSTRIGYSAHWAERNDNPVLASFLKLLAERYPFTGKHL